ncbi:MAG: S41 family peptidase [Pyrinomonadaceae bacterium]
MRSKFLLYFAIFVFLFAFAGDGLAQKKKPRVKSITATVTVRSSQQPAAQKANERRQSAFYMAWSTLNERYFDKTFGGLDWEKIRAEFAPRVSRAKNDAEFHRLLIEMIGRLGKSHLDIIVPEYFERIQVAKERARVREKEIAAERKEADPGKPDEEQDELFGDKEGKRYGIGVELRMIGDQIVITNVEKQSGATLAGLKTGYVIEKINGVSLKEMIGQAVISGVSTDELRYLLPIELVTEFLDGEAGSSVFLTILDENDTPKEITVERLELNGDTIVLSKNLPEHFLRYESRSLSEDVGYIRFSAFAVPVVAKFCDSLTEFGNKKAIVIDLRGNLGGILVSMIGLSGMLTDKPITLGTFVSRAGSQKFTVASKAKNFKGRIVVLVDGQTMSASEMFAAGLQSNRRAVVVGEKTGGQSLPAIWTKLPTNAVMMYPVSDFHTLAGKSLEGVGLIPDHTVARNRGSLLQGVDNQLEKALALISDDKAFAPAAVTKLSTANGGASELPPPPKPVPAVTSGSGTGSPLPPPPVISTAIAPKPTPTASDERSLKIIADFANAIGGADAVKKFGSYEAKGRLVPSENVELEGEFATAHQTPDKTSVVINTASTGEIRTIYNGKEIYQQSEYGMDQNTKSQVVPSRVDLLSAYFAGLDLDLLKGLKFEGDYQVDGRLRYVLSATSPEGHSIGLSFDSGTKLLVTFSQPGVLYTFSDYRKVDGVLVPYKFELDRIMNIHLDTLTRNIKIDAAMFEKKENCFDKPLVSKN